jgi:hypothetical protein
MLIKKSLDYFLILLLCSCQFALGQTNNLEKKSIEYLHQSLSTRLHLNSNQLKLYPDSATIGNTSSWLWNIFDAMTLSNGIYYDPAQYNSFNDGYGSILYESETPGCLSQNCDLGQAILKYTSDSIHVWNKTIDDLNAELKFSDSLKFISDTTIVVYSDDGDIIENDTIQIKVNFNHLLVFYSYPYSQKDSLNPQLQFYSPWYTPCILQEAYENENYCMLNKDDWDSAFRPNGYMQEVCEALIIVDGGDYEITISNGTLKFSKKTIINSPILFGVLMYSIKDLYNSINKL